MKKGGTWVHVTAPRCKCQRIQKVQTICGGHPQRVWNSLRLKLVKRNLWLWSQNTNCHNQARIRWRLKVGSSLGIFGSNGLSNLHRVHTRCGWNGHFLGIDSNGSWEFDCMTSRNGHHCYVNEERRAVRWVVACWPQLLCCNQGRPPLNVKHHGLSNKTPK